MRAPREQSCKHALKKTLINGQEAFNECRMRKLEKCTTLVICFLVTLSLSKYPQKHAPRRNSDATRLAPRTRASTCFNHLISDEGCLKLDGVIKNWYIPGCDVESPECFCCLIFSWATAAAALLTEGSAFFRLSLWLRCCLSSKTKVVVGLESESWLNHHVKPAPTSFVQI